MGLGFGIQHYHRVPLSIEGIPRVPEARPFGVPKSMKPLKNLAAVLTLCFVCVGCESMADSLFSQRNESPYHSFIRHSDENWEQMNHPEWRQ